MEASIELPLFPIPVVLFPAMPLPLHIFEERYKQMIGECLESQAQFGVLLQTQTHLCNVGCTAEVAQVLRRYTDGRLDILVTGRQRFQVLEYLQRKPYLEGIIEYFNDEAEEVPNNLLERVMALYKEMMELATKGLGAVTGIFDPAQFSYVIASAVDLDLEERQTLLELTSTTGRLRKLAVALEQMIKRLRRAKSNGRVHHG